MALVLCPSDIAHTRRRAALQPGIDAVWRLCGASAGPPARLSEKMWAAFWMRVLKVVAPPHEYDGEAARGWCGEDWANALLERYRLPKSIRNNQNIRKHNCSIELKPLNRLQRYLCSQVNRITEIKKTTGS